MKLGGWQKFTLVDYPGKIAATIFTLGCNFYCGFCHNPELVDLEKMKNQPIIPEEEIFKFLKTRRGILDGVCITGGEPTLYEDLPAFIKKIKALGFKIKLDTNGTNPEMLVKLIQDDLVDYIAMDIKGPLEKYEEIIGRKINLEDIKKSAEMIKKFPDYEFRTTLLPRFHRKEDLIKMAEWLKGAKKYFLQQFYATKILDPGLKDEKSYSREQMAEFCQMLRPYFQSCSVRE